MNSDGEGTDVTIIACGLMVSTGIAAAKLLAARGIQARVVDMYCIKPLDSGLIEACAKETGLSWGIGTICKTAGKIWDGCSLDGSGS